MNQELLAEIIIFGPFMVCAAILGVFIAIHDYRSQS
jgi:hypothetical protein